ncbi:MAG: M23 family metallopeptidase [Rhodospirillales bacterium]|jgi:murein DD-endopeptidase MepM/ murein hydrolase activator NlpD|nr:M23 family metallopeptidase [Rhodospirillales bacterium]
MSVKRTAFFALVLCVAGARADAIELDFEGQFTQGGLVIARAAPGVKAYIDGTPVRVSPAGDFIMGFGRNAKPNVEVRIVMPSGASEVRQIAVKPREFKVQRIDGLPPKQVTPDPEVVKRIQAESALIKDARKIDTPTPHFKSGFAWPIHGVVSGVFGSQRILNGKPRAPHSGVDIAAPRGAIVRASADGVISLVHQDMYFTGKTVMIDHGFGLASVFIHMDEILVRDGQRVDQGTPIGKVGATGRATGPHLHWGISLFQTRLDPSLTAPPMPREK